MATARQNTAASLIINIHNSQSANQLHLWKPVQMGAAILKRLWFHGQAYGTILGVILLTFASLIFLVIHRFYYRESKECNAAHFPTGCSMTAERSRGVTRKSGMGKILRRQ